MESGPKFGPPETPEEENELLMERNKYLLEHISGQDKELAKAKEINGIDHLTGARNRQDFDKELDTSLKIIRGEFEQRRSGEKLLDEVCVVLLDADHFKNVNDTYGHPVGDEVLRAIAMTLRENIRDIDMAARWGGEEFAVLLKGVSLEKASEIAEDLRQKIGEITIADHPDIKITASFGVASSRSATEGRELVKQVDDALYAAKRSGRNRVVTFEE